MLKYSMIALLCLGLVTIGLAEAPAVAADETLWHLRAIHPGGRTFDVKAVDDDGTLYDVKAIEQDDNVHMLDVKAFVGKQRKPVKVIVSNERYTPVMALDVHGKNLKLVAVNAEGKRFDIKGVRRTGNIVHIKAIGRGGRFWAVKAMSPDGRVYDVKGVKMLKTRREMLVGAVQVHAHVKALPPAGRN